jgi:type II restriction/modification system DNA methylase subunit YeeA
MVRNPPFLGNKKMNRVLKPAYVQTLKRTYEGRVPGGADLVIYWFQRSLEQIAASRAAIAGLVGTQAIRSGASRQVLKRNVENGSIFDAWSDEEWTVEGANVRVSLVCFSGVADRPAKLNGNIVNKIAPELFASSEIELPKALEENKKVAYQGTISGGPFEVSGDLARGWLTSPQNPDGSRNQTILRPWRNADDLTDRVSDPWMIDFPAQTSEASASMFESPFKHLNLAWQSENERLQAEGKPPLRENEPHLQAKRWLLQRPRPKFRAALAALPRYIATPRVAKFRTFTWLPASVIPDTRIVAIARDDDTFFGLLQSKHHELWSLRYGGRHGVGNDPEYIHTQIFETFPFPEGLTPNLPAADYAHDPRAQAIAAAAERVNGLRENWLKPADLVQLIPEVVPGYPDRLLPIDHKAAAVLKKRTLTNLYNEHPTWLANAHRDLDAAVAVAYGWPVDLTDDQILERLFELNHQRAAMHT